MKRSTLILLPLFFVIVLLASCKPKERCPAYGKDLQKKEQKESGEQKREERV